MNWQRVTLILVVLFSVNSAALANDWKGAFDNDSCLVKDASHEVVCKPRFWDSSGSPIETFCEGDAYCRCQSKSNPAHSVVLKKKPGTCAETCFASGYEPSEFEPKEELFSASTYCTANPSEEEGECAEPIQKIELDFNPQRDLSCAGHCGNGEVERICKKQNTPNPPIHGVKLCCNLNLKRNCWEKDKTVSVGCSDGEEDQDEEELQDQPLGAHP